MRKLYIASQKTWMIVGGSLLLIVGILCCIFIPSNNREEESFIFSESKTLLAVHVSGFVHNPDRIYYLPEGSRVQDALDAAGGVTEEADISKLNLASFLKDGQKITVPCFGTDEDSDNLININEATLIQLQTLSGIGPSLAQKIIDYRETNGPFSDIEELKNVSGIGEKLFTSIEDKIRV